MIYIDLIFNLSLLVALSIVSGFIEKRWPRHTRLVVLLQGSLFGGTAVLGMLRPLNLGPGLIFDGRSVMISLCAFFFGPWAATVAGVMTAAYRMALGGAGTLTGSLVILSSAGIGLLARYRLMPHVKPPSTRRLYFFGLAVHLAMLALMFTLPRGAGISIVMRIGLPVMLLYPLATILAGKILSDQVEVKQGMEALRQSEENYRVLVENAVVGIYRVRADGRFIMVNQKMAEMFEFASPQVLLESADGIEKLYARPEERQLILKEINMKGFVTGKEVEFRKNDGSSMWIRLNSRATTVAPDVKGDVGSKTT